MNQTKISQGNSPDRRELLKMSLALGIGVSLIYLAFLKPGIWGYDGNDMLEVAKSLVTQQSFAVPKGIGILGRDGQYYSIRYPLLSILAVPFVSVGFALAHLLNLPSHYVAAVCALVLSLLLTAGTTVLVALLALRLGSTKQGAYFAALSFAFGTTALVYAREFFAEPLLAFLTAVSLYLAIGQTKREHIIASILAGLMVTAKPAGVVVGPVLSAYFLAKRRPLRIVIGPVIGTAMGVMLYFIYNYMRFGSFLSFGQKTSRFGLEGIPERFFGMLFAFGAGGGLIWYCPPVILAIWALYKAFQSKSKILEVLAIAGVFLGYLVLHSFWEFGGWSWGPRFLVPTLPGLLALTGLLGKQWRKWLILLTVIGLIVNAPTLVSFYQRYYAEASDGGYLRRALTLWVSPFDSPLFQSWGAAYRQLQDAFASNASNILREAGAPPPGGEMAKAQLARIVAVWWWLLPAAGIPVWLAVALALILVGLGVWMLHRGWVGLQVKREPPGESIFVENNTP